MDSCVTIEDLARHFSLNLAQLEMKCNIKDYMEYDRNGCQQALQGLAKRVSNLENTLQFMRSSLNKEKAVLQKKEELCMAIQTIKAEYLHCQENIPKTMPNSDLFRTSEKLKQQSANENRVMPNSKNQNEVQTNSNPKKKPQIPELQFLTVDEFESCPKYIRGRVVYNKVNNGISELNKAFSGKYTILSSSRRRNQSDHVRKHTAQYREQENKETQGVSFITEKDIKEFCDYKIDAVGRTMLTILRHCGRIREIRGGGITRYAIR